VAWRPGLPLNRDGKLEVLHDLEGPMVNAPVTTGFSQ